MSGYFITLEGPDGAGKTTVLKEIVQQLQGEFISDYLVTREPGGSKISEEIRNLILDPKNTEMNDKTEALLYAASRSQHVSEIILPALQAGKIVFSDRFVDSSLAYQGVGRNLGIEEVQEINDFATGHLVPDLTLFFDLPPKVGLDRILAVRADHEDRLEQEKLAFHEKVYAGYQEIKKMYPERIKSINANQPIKQVVSDSIKVLKTYLPELFKKEDQA